MKLIQLRIHLLTFYFLFNSMLSYSWTEHPLLTTPALSMHPVWSGLKPVEAKTLSTFLLAHEMEMEVFLAEQERWSREHLPNYYPRPEALAFRATGNREDVKARFLRAIRINPAAKIPLYLHHLPGQAFDTMRIADPALITTLSDLSVMVYAHYTWLDEGEQVWPLQVLSTASDEVDYGFDLGLFEDNETAQGKIYSFGKQAFGNPALEYSSQAPFHMGFYHESRIVYALAPFIKNTFVDYRINLYRMLAEFAFTHNEPYWGWRFTGWAMHYIGDLSMPYHCQPLPGVSLLKMLWINLKAMLGWEQDKRDAIQLVSNKHGVMEKYQWAVLTKAHLEQDFNHPMLRALREPYPIQKWDDRFVYDVVSKKSVEMAVSCNDVLLASFPARLVSDPKVEAMNMKEMEALPAVVINEKGKEALAALDEMIAERFRSFSMAMQAFLEYMIPYVTINQTDKGESKPNS